MKKGLKGLAIVATLATIGTLNVNATASKKIDTSTCENVYTNYYLLLEANTTDYFTGSAKNRNTVGNYTNNKYLTTFDESNVGYGQVTVTKNSTTSSDGITSWSLADYYKYLSKVGGNIGSNARYTEGNNQYFSHGSWVDIDDGNKNKNSHVPSTDSINQMINSTVNGTSNIERLTNISNNAGSEMRLSIARDYDGKKAASSVSYNGKNWNFHPAVYYIQYCSKKNNDNPPTPESNTYNVTYIKNTTDVVVNMPINVTVDIKNDVNISELVPRREGYIFLGWSTRPDDSTGHTTYIANYNYTERKDLTLYAIWQKEGDSPITNFYKVIYLKNTTDTVINMPTNVKINIEYDVNISALVPKREGYTFLGWSTTPDDSTGHTTYIANYNYTDRKDLTLYAIWQKNGETPGNPDPTPTDNPDNPRTAVSDYLVPVCGAVSSSGAALAFLKRKRFFKQL